MITITSKIDGFRRAGIAHPAAPTPYPDDAFSEKQLDMLRAEPMLVVVEKPGEKAADENKDKKNKDKKDKDKNGGQPEGQDGKPPAEGEQK